MKDFMIPGREKNVISGDEYERIFLPLNDSFHSRKNLKITMDNKVEYIGRVTNLINQVGSIYHPESIALTIELKTNDGIALIDTLRILSVSIPD